MERSDRALPDAEEEVDADDDAAAEYPTDTATALAASAADEAGTGGHRSSSGSALWAA